MAEITGITPQIKDKERCNIEVDGRFFCGMKLETVVKHRLKVGVAVSEEELSRMQLESEKLTALDKALTYITVSMKTEKDIRAYLRKKGYLEDISDYVVEKMRSYGYLDDAAYARAYIEHAGKRKGSRLIAMELRQKGVSDEAIEEALSLADIENMSEENRIKALRPVDILFSDCGSVVLTDFFASLAKNGCQIYQKKTGTSFASGELVKLCDENGFFALGQVTEYPDGSAIKPVKQLRL